MEAPTEDKNHKTYLQRITKENNTREKNQLQVVEDVL